jgi:hypothetical protein
MATYGRDAHSESPLLIIAANYELARLYVHEHQLGPEGREWRFVSRPEQVLGMRGGRYVAVTLGSRGSGRSALQELERELRRRGFEHWTGAASPID